MKVASVFLAAAVAAGVVPGAVARAETPAPAAGAQANAPLVSVVAATRRSVVDRAIVTGTLVAREEVRVAPDVDGFRIEAILAEEGDTVASGQVLARLATDTIEVSLAQNASQLARADAGIAQATAQVAEAEANQVQAAAALERSRSLAGSGVISQDVLEQRLALARATDARLNSARQALASAEADRRLIEAQRAELDLRRSKTEIKAPSGGLVLARTARLGAIASPGGDALFRIAQNGDIELEAEVPETVVARLAVGQTVAVTPAGATAPVAGTIRLVAPEVAADTRLGRVRVALDRSAPLRVGTFARGVVEIAKSEGLALPVSAVQTAGGKSTVQVVRDGVVETRAVELGLTGEGWVEIRSGIAEGDVVVARAGTFLRDGDAVRPVDADSEVKG